MRNATNITYDLQGQRSNSGRKFDEITMYSISNLSQRLLVSTHTTIINHGKQNVTKRLKKLVKVIVQMHLNTIKSFLTEL